jgi:hypothetical protein
MRLAVSCSPQPQPHLIRGPGVGARCDWSEPEKR